MSKDEHVVTMDEVRGVIAWRQKSARDGLTVDAFDRAIAEVAHAAAEKALRPIRDALAGHPRCEVHPDGDPIACGWKRAVSGVQAVLDEADRLAAGGEAL